MAQGKSGHHISCPGTMPSLVSVADEVAGALDVRRCTVHHRFGESRHSDGPSVSGGLGNNLGIFRRFLGVPQHSQDSALRET
jgi:hypothetical protein